MSAHTPTPWQVHAASCAHVPPFVRVSYRPPFGGGGYQIIADCSHAVTGGTDCEANAAFIVRAVNAHHDLVKALASAADDLEIIAKGIEALGVENCEKLAASIRKRASVARAFLTVCAGAT